MFGPGTLEMTRLNGGMRCGSPIANATRAARAVSAGGAKSVTFSTSPVGIAACCALATFIASCTLVSRSCGSARLVGSAASMAATLLPRLLLLASSRTETGTIATSGESGSAS